MLPRPGTLIRQTFTIYRKKFFTFALLGAIATLISLVQILAIRIHSFWLFFISLAATIVVSYIVYLAMLRVATNPARLNTREALKSIEPFILPAAYVSVVMILVAFGGTLLFIIPGILISVFIIFSLYAVVVDHYEKLDAVLYSWHIVRGKWLDVFVRLFIANLVFGLLTLAIFGICWSLGLGETPMQTIARAATGSHAVSYSQSILEQIVTNIFSLPLTITFLALMYEKLKAEKPEAPDEAESFAPKRYIKILTVLGILFIVLGIFLSSLQLMKTLPEIIRVTHTPAAVFSAF